MSSCILSVGFFVLLQDMIRASGECSFPFLCPVAIAVWASEFWHGRWSRELHSLCFEIWHRARSEVIWCFPVLAKMLRNAANWSWSSYLKPMPRSVPWLRILVSALSFHRRHFIYWEVFQQCNLNTSCFRSFVLLMCVALCVFYCLKTELNKLCNQSWVMLRGFPGHLPFKWLTRLVTQHVG